jgi:hypothetical protein
VIIGGWRMELKECSGEEVEGFILIKKKVANNFF